MSIFNTEFGSIKKQITKYPGALEFNQRAIQNSALSDEEKKQLWELMTRLSQTPTLRHYHGTLHSHTQDKEGEIPVSGSNCGALPVVEVLRYAGERMGQNFVAITDHSRDGYTEGTLKYWGPRGHPELAEYGDERVLEVFRRIDAIKNPALKVFKGIEVNLLPNGEFDTQLTNSSQVERS